MPSFPRMPFGLLHDHLASIESDQEALADQLDLCRRCSGLGQRLEALVDRARAFAVARIVSLTLLGLALLSLAMLLA